MTPEEFKKYGYEIIDWIADYRSNISDYPVMSTIQPGTVRERLPDSPPENPDPFESVINDLDNIILPGISHWNHPNNFAYFPSNATLPSVLGDLLCSGIGGIGLNWQSMPALTEVEEVVCDWMRQMLGLSSNWEGVIQDTASTSTLVALLCAREQASNHSQIKNGLQGEKLPLIIYSSIQSHSSVKKAALLAGFGLNNIRTIETDENFAIDVEQLKIAIEQDIKKGLKPCAVIATIGTTNTTAMDPISDILSLTQKHNMWLHVDAAMAGTAMILPECRWMWDGIEGADSIIINPHKWLGVVFDCSLYYIRNREHLVRVMSTNPSYLQTSKDNEVKNYRDWGIPLGRRFRALKLWCLIKEQGVSGLQERIRKDIKNAKWLKDQIENEPQWEILAPVTLQTICVRHTPSGLKNDLLEKHTLQWVTDINNGGAAYLTPGQLNGKWMVRISIGAEATTLKHVKALWITMKSAVNKESQRNR
ncbi:MAG: aminotransferase class I/II-fold pyridoxal phosphate-dependent enzyme [Candidatus Marinimicrobia bacterium]|jgi:aromatic-L-amino-acid decarboxylase|nr:aminotransferase class I/II-fold pyridoxal phosphate-dependent enzyme [Candidatus Neomarinimicrobiota bacterium]MBT3683621.1 aminotransferase class I/II-fold pyridoxal phosphate-dependent enzyme [Candidatus Neomarinimicrobiota bacterium]MBT3760400.1 aminotransferase class I/II-fold pyridoxal phosphate-dependent enzyme [Candidatus Neomarinimicrobiota bacterium]MBT3896522.1 aminotransferase class I/II-fold pyridoxal phosphate-dependent enzyme [Candidatus Neomarinimicrobiota bacterium]MBT417356